MKLILFTANPTASVTLAHDSGFSISGASIDGTVTLSLPAELPDGNGASLQIDKDSYRGVLWLSKLNPVNGSASFAVDTFPFRQSIPIWPDDGMLRKFSGNFCGQQITGITGPTIRPGLLFTPG